MILLTGVTGNVGGATASELNKRGVRFRAVVRTPDKVKPDISMQNEIIPGDLADVSVMKEALQGVDRILLVTPNSEQQALLEKSVVDLAASAGVQQIVKISSRFLKVPEILFLVPSSILEGRTMVKRSRK